MYDAEMLEMSKAILWILSAIAGILFMTTFKGRWFFSVMLCFMLGTSNAAYTVYTWVGALEGGGNVGVVASHKLEAGDTDDLINEEVFGIHHLTAWTFDRCPLYAYPNLHLNDSTSCWYANDARTMFPIGSTTIQCCKICVGYSQAQRHTVTVEETTVPPDFWASVSAGAVTGASGETITPIISYGEDGFTPDGFGYEYAPPEGVITVYDPETGITTYTDDQGNIVGDFTIDENGFPSWVGETGETSDPIIDEMAYYATFADWFSRWKLAESDNVISRAEFSSYMTTAAAQGVSVLEALVSLGAAVTSSDSSAAMAELSLVVNSQTIALSQSIDGMKFQLDDSLIDIKNAVDGIPSPPSVDLSGVESRLDNIADLLTFTEETFPEMEETPDSYDFDVALPSDIVQLQSDFEDWNTGINGLMGQGLDFTFTQIFGQLPAIPTQDMMFDTTFEIDFMGFKKTVPVVCKFSDYPSLAIFRTTVLFLMCVLWCFLVYNIISKGLDI